MSLTSSAVVALLAFVAPLVVRLIRLPVPDIVIQIMLGVVVDRTSSAGREWTSPFRCSLIGLSFLLFLAGLEIDFARLRGSVATLAFGGYLLSFVLALIVGSVLTAAHLVRSPLLIAIILSATALGVVLPALKDSGQIDTTLGRLVVAGASVAEVVPVVLLWLLFSRNSGGIGTQVTLLSPGSAR